MPQFDAPGDRPTRFFQGDDLTDGDIPLGISRKVTIRTVAPPGRVPDSYFRAWPIRMVLRRWRRRVPSEGSGTTFHGARLFPSLWAVLDAMHETRPDLRLLEAEALRALQRQVLSTEPTAVGDATAIESQTLHALVGHVSRRDRLTRLQRADRPWPLVPELLLYKRSAGRVHGVRFVHVMRHDAGLDSDDLDDLRHLRACGSRAGLWRFADAPHGSPAGLRAARKRLMPTRHERRLQQIRGFFPWGDIEPCRGRVPASRTSRAWGPASAPERPQVASEACLGCGRPPTELEWVYFSSPSWTWARQCGRAGWLAICPDCQHQIDFRLSVMN